MAKHVHDWEYFLPKKYEYTTVVGSVRYSYITTNRRRKCNDCGCTQYSAQPYLTVGGVYWQDVADLPVARALRL